MTSTVCTGPCDKTVVSNKPVPQQWFEPVYSSLQNHLKPAPNSVRREQLQEHKRERSTFHKCASYSMSLVMQYCVARHFLQGRDAYLHLSCSIVGEVIAYGTLAATNCIASLDDIVFRHIKIQGFWLFLPAVGMRLNMYKGMCTCRSM